MNEICLNAMSGQSCISNVTPNPDLYSGFPIAFLTQAIKGLDQEVLKNSAPAIRITRGIKKLTKNVPSPHL